MIGILCGQRWCKNLLVHLITMIKNNTFEKFFKMHVNFSHAKSDNYAIETEYLLFKTKFLQGLHQQLTVGITYPSESYNLSRKLLSTGRSSPSSHFGDGSLCFIAQTKDKGNQCSTLIFLLTCPLGNYVSSFTCRVYFLVAQKKSPARFVRSFIEFSILVPSNFNA